MVEDSFGEGHFLIGRDVEERPAPPVWRQGQGAGVHEVNPMEEVEERQPSPDVTLRAAPKVVPAACQGDAEMERQAKERRNADG